jgi:hypothetical protein
MNYSGLSHAEIAERYGMELEQVPRFARSWAVERSPVSGTGNRAFRGRSFPFLTVLFDHV